MRAAVYHGPNKVEITDVPEPHPGAGQVKIHVGFNGICGTDLHEYYAGPIFIPTEPHALTGQQMPLVLGHEFSGTITELGAGVTGWAIGDRVAIEPIYRCGQCGPCRAGNYNICQTIGFHGLMSDGGMAEYTVVPTDMLHALPDSVSLELGALVEPMSVAYHAATLGDVQAGDTAVVFGAGPIGIGLWFALRGKGLENVTVVEPSQT
ncbi:MAG: alcohol dehydrogenase catalytic domain-containing protein, partial [Rhodococcus sp. (in: high G+C Gram-positive bacteria)]